MIQMLFSRQGVKELVINYKAQNVVEPKLFCLFLFFWERGVMFSNLEGVIDFFFFSSTWSSSISICKIMYVLQSVSSTYSLPHRIDGALTLSVG